MNVSVCSNQSFVKTSCSPILEQSLIINKNKHNLKNSLLWGFVNLFLLSLLLYDLSYACSFYYDYYQLAEYSLVLILSLNVLYYIIKIVQIYYKTASEQLTINPEQKVLLGVKDSDPSYKIVTPIRNVLSKSSVTPNTSLQTTPMNLTALSWMSNTSQNESLNYSVPSPSWTYQKATPNKLSPVSYSRQSSPVVQNSFHDVSTIGSIVDENSLKEYLKEHEEGEKISKIANKSHQSANLLSSFWSHPVTKTARDMTLFLKRCQYQMSTQSPNKSLTSSPNVKVEDKSNVSQIPALEVWTRINVDIVALTQWNENLRMWFSQTILERLVKEFGMINDTLEKHGMTDVKIGCVGLDRIRKTAQMVQVTQFIPSLSTILSFLEVHANQEYLENRIRELAKGGCMSEFKWNGGGHYNGKEWDESLPSDCKIVMHLLAAYMDTQLMPSPNMPDTKAFTGIYFIRATDKMPTLTASSLFIHEVSEKPPHYRVVVGEKIYEMVKGYNNLFHSILFFIYHVNKMEQGMLGRVNLGRAGVNMLWVIGIDQ